MEKIVAVVRKLFRIKANQKYAGYVSVRLVAQGSGTSREEQPLERVLRPYHHGASKHGNRANGKYSNT